MLVEAAIDGSPDARESLWEQCNEIVLRLAPIVARRYGMDSAEFRDEISYMTFVRLLTLMERKPEVLLHVADWAKFLYCVVIYCAREFRRKGARWTGVHLVDTEGAEYTNATDPRRDMDRLLRDLDREDRLEEFFLEHETDKLYQTMLRDHLAGKTLEELAKELRLGLSSVRGRIYRLRKAFAQWHLEFQRIPE